MSNLLEGIHSVPYSRESERCLHIHYNVLESRNPPCALRKNAEVEESVCIVCLHGVPVPVPDTRPVDEC